MFPQEHFTSNKSNEKYVTILNVIKDSYAGIETTGSLRAKGVNWRQLKKLVFTGELKEIRRGWYAYEHADPAAIAAIKHGGQLGCISGCNVHGLWIPPQYQRSLHICVKSWRNAQPNLAESGVITHRGADSKLLSIRSVEDCLVDVMKHHDAETALVMLESAVNMGLITYRDGEALIARQSAQKRKLLRHFAPGAESGSETRVRLWFNRRNLPVRTQERIRSVGRVDLLVGKSFIVECDSRAHHTQDENYHKDRERDFTSEELGYQVLRLSYAHIWREWDKTQKRLAGIIEKRKYRREPQV
ncbi:hypothetical protein HMPREF0580_0283 [Mobiluncus mulieris ATCC 35239]|uniref:DUF559 domain-containing protein n=1 Tax=Mobiluncus mulieris ATCC 35239 TaxID=871571 RepID=E0QN19_9ACTO|nr:hypothetical protein HMPREF0580_0283 [Mobiluncus mulieris ATCC 35239]